ncbi:MAG: tRNA (N6-threonylcarbamoyladenosine(37)-N6)-methyltransferase TrmO [Deltaproteobacteria bacterium]|nr:tRNA (N6-threonylcarbamoyladenosine(37)-N6)-methyltransferase TrmO [Deltaproteobacteria bacterium]
MVSVQPIGVIQSSYTERKGTPHQGRHQKNECTLEVFEEYEPGLLDIDSCTHLIVLYWQDRSDRTILQTKTPWGPETHGVFATRSPNRPNPIALCVVNLLGRNGRFLKVTGLDALDGSPLIDLKPYSAEVDSFPQARVGWRRGQGKEPR